MNSAFTIPNLLSVSRGLLAPLAFLAIYQSDYLAASWVLLAALITDVTDGILARRWQQTSPLGGLLDHGSDAILVTAILAALAFQGYVTPLLPMLVPLAFTQYALDSKALRGRPLQASKIGRYNGILYFNRQRFSDSAAGSRFVPSHGPTNHVVFLDTRRVDPCLDVGSGYRVV